MVEISLMNPISTCVHYSLNAAGQLVSTEQELQYCRKHRSPSLLAANAARAGTGAGVGAVAGTGGGQGREGQGCLGGGQAHIQK